MLTPGNSMGGRYRLDERIATGGMGEVWKAEDTVLGRTVAVKVLQPAMLEEPGFAERFRAEARVMATINHPGVVQVYDYGESDIEGGGKVAYLVMEYVEGEPLHHVLARVGRLAPNRVMDLIAQAADALQAAHDRGIVHRDVKPGNLLVRPNGKLVLTDFGIARSAISGNLTQAGAVLGTASYVSPEQATGTGNITPASDVYSLGVVAYQCLAGRRPFEGDNPIEVAMRHIRDEPPPLPPDVPEGARAVVMRAMAKDVAARWPDARSMAEAARAVAEGRAVPGGAATTAVLGSTGTAVMPAASPSSGATGQFARGAAAVRPGGRGDDYEDHPGYPGYDAPGYDGPGYDPHRQGPGGRKGNGKLILGVVAGVLAIVLGIGLVVWASGLLGESQDPGANPSPSASPTAATITLNEDDYVGRDVDEVVAELEGKNLKVTREERSRRGFEAGTVTGIEPAGEPLKPGDSVTVYYQPESGGGLPTLPGFPNGDDDEGEDGEGDQPGTEPSTPPTTEPSETTSGFPSPPPGDTGGGAGGMTRDDSQKDS